MKVLLQVVIEEENGVQTIKFQRDITKPGDSPLDCRKLTELTESEFEFGEAIHRARREVV